MNESFRDDVSDKVVNAFAQAMIEQEWRMYDLRIAEKLATEEIEIRHGRRETVFRYRISKVRLGLTVETKEVF